MDKEEITGAAEIEAGVIVEVAVVEITIIEIEVTEVVEIEAVETVIMIRTEAVAEIGITTTETGTIGVAEIEITEVEEATEIIVGQETKKAKSAFVL